MYNIDDHIKHFSKKTEFTKIVIAKGDMEYYYEKENKISNQRKIFYKEHKDNFHRKRMIDLFFYRIN